jgi:hypothetical protein
MAAAVDRHEPCARDARRRVDRESMGRQVIVLGADDERRNRQLLQRDPGGLLA